MEGEFLGKGFGFPLKIQDGCLEIVSGSEKIKQSIYVILMTRQGERPMRPDFGSRLWEYVFELPGETVQNLMCLEMEQAVSRWEHRVDNVSAQTDLSLLPEGKILISISYTVRATNRPDNLVFPFYLEEGRW